MYKTNRTYTNVETSELFALWSDQDTHRTTLISEETGAEIRAFYICAFADCRIKTMDKKIIFLPSGTFYHLKEGEIITHRKFIGFTKFKSV